MGLGIGIGISLSGIGGSVTGSFSGLELIEGGFVCLQDNTAVELVE
jgi:hypothetical protein